MARTYKTKPGDRWDMIALEVYGNELLVDQLMKANKIYLEVFQFDAGIVLVVPDLEDELDGLPPWRD